MTLKQQLAAVRDAAASAGFTDSQSYAHPEDVIRALRESVNEAWCELDALRRAIDTALALRWPISLDEMHRTQSQKDTERIERLAQLKS